MNKHNIQTLATLAGVSAATVSRVLNGNPQVKPHLKERVLQVLEETGIWPDPTAPSLRAGKTRTISVILPMIDTDFYHRLLHSMEGVFDEAGYDMALFPLVGGFRVKKFQDPLSLPYRADALMLASLNPDRLYAGGRVPFDRPITLVDTFHKDHHSFSIDNHRAGKMAAQHLLLNREPIVLVGLKQDETGPFASPVLTERMAGIQQALLEHRGNLAGAVLVDELDTEEGRQAARDWLEQHPGPCQFLCLADTLALGVRRHLQERQLECRVMGFDDHPFAERENLTSVQQPIEQMGERAARHVVDQLKGQVYALVGEVLHPRLKIRQSSRLWTHS